MGGLGHTCLYLAAVWNNSVLVKELGSLEFGGLGVEVLVVSEFGVILGWDEVL